MTTKRTPDKRKHKAIMLAAMRLFLKNGYSKTSMDAIAVAASVTKQTVYGHYKSKEVLFSEMVTELCRKHTPGEMLSEKNQSIEQALYTLGIGFINMATSKEGLAATRLVVAEAQHHPQLARRYYESGSRQMLTMAAHFLEQATKQERLAIHNPMSAASYFFSLLKGNYYLRTLLNIKPLPRQAAKEKHVRETVTIFMRIYGGKTPLHTRNVL